MTKKSVAMYLLAILCVFCGVVAIFFSPDLYKWSHLNLGPGIAFLFAIGGTLSLDSADKA